MPQFVVITGSDTGVGKTVVTTALGRSLAAAGRRVVAIKPIESGCPAEMPVATEDGVRIARATGQQRPTAALRRYRAAVTPAVAADLEGRPVPLADLLDEIHHQSRDADIVLLEGAGGLLSPPAWDWSYLDLARELGAAVLVVVANRLGCLSHTLLTVSALTAAGVPVIGLVMSEVSEVSAADESTSSNQAALARLLPAARIAALDYLTPDRIDTARLDALLPWFDR